MYMDYKKVSIILTFLIIIFASISGFFYYQTYIKHNYQTINENRVVKKIDEIFWNGKRENTQYKYEVNDNKIIASGIVVSIPKTEDDPIIIETLNNENKVEKLKFFFNSNTDLIPVNNFRSTNPNQIIFEGKTQQEILSNITINQHILINAKQNNINLFEIVNLTYK